MKELKPHIHCSNILYIFVFSLCFIVTACVLFTYLFYCAIWSYDHKTKSKYYYYYYYYYSPLKCSRMTHVNNSCQSLTRLSTNEMSHPAFTPQPQSITARWPVYTHSRPTEYSDIIQNRNVQSIFYWNSTMYSFIFLFTGTHKNRNLIA